MSIVPKQCISKFTAASCGLRCYCTPLVLVIQFLLANCKHVLVLVLVLCTICTRGLSHSFSLLSRENHTGHGHNYFDDVSYDGGAWSSLSILRLVITVHVVDIQPRWSLLLFLTTAATRGRWTVRMWSFVVIRHVTSMTAVCWTLFTAASMTKIWNRNNQSHMFHMQGVHSSVWFLFRTLVG